MPTYCYKSEDGEVFERNFPMSRVAPSEMIVPLIIEGRVIKKQIFYRDYQAEAVGGIVKRTDNPVKSRPKKSWPMEPCVASGVHASQAGELRDHYKKHGLNVQVNSDGDPIYESAAQRKKALKCRGMHDKASFN